MHHTMEQITLTTKRMGLVFYCGAGIKKKKKALTKTPAAAVSDLFSCKKWHFKHNAASWRQSKGCMRLVTGWLLVENPAPIQAGKGIVTTVVGRKEL